MNKPIKRTKVGGVAIRRRRQHFQLYQYQCAERLGVHRRTWMRWEKHGVPLAKLDGAIDAIDAAQIHYHGGIQLDAFADEFPA